MPTISLLHSNAEQRDLPGFPPGPLEQTVLRTAFRQSKHARCCSEHVNIGKSFRFGPNLLTQQGSISVKTLVAVGLPQVSQILVSLAEVMDDFLEAGAEAGPGDMTDPCVPAMLLIEDAAECIRVFSG